MKQWHVRHAFGDGRYLGECTACGSKIEVTRVWAEDAPFWQRLFDADHRACLLQAPARAEREPGVGHGGLTHDQRVLWDTASRLEVLLSAKGDPPDAGLTALFGRIEESCGWRPREGGWWRAPVGTPGDGVSP